MIMKTNILHNIISSQKNFITRCIALAMVVMVGVGNAWADPIQLSDLVFSTSNTKRIVNEDFSSTSTTNQTTTKSANSNLSGFGIFTKIMNGNTSNHYIIESSTFSSNAVKLTNGSNNMLILSTADLSFGSTGAFRFKTSSSASNMVIGLYSTKQADTEYYAKARASVYIKNHQGAIYISNNASTSWQSVGSAEGIIDICVIYNNTNSGTTYGNSISLGSKKANVYINGNCAMNNDETPKAFSIPGTSLDYYRLSCTNSSGNSAYVDDIQIWNELPSYDNSCAAPTAVSSSLPTNTGATLTVTDANNVNKYDFCCNTSSSASKSVTASVSGGKSKAISGLNYGTKYYYWARTDCGSSSYSIWYPSSDPSYFTTTCPNPTSISAGSITKTGVTFTIVDENSPVLSTYGIYYSTNSTAPTSGTSATTTSTSTSKSVTGLTAGTKYYYWVRGQGPDANSTTWVSGGNFTTLHEYTLTYKETDGTGNGSGKVDENATSFTNTSAPSKDGYRLEGFYTSSGLSTKVASNARAFVANIDGWTGAGGAYTKGANADLYLKWDANTYTVTFDKNGGGTGTGTADQDFTYGVAQNLRACGFTAPTDKYFLGWNTNKNATTALYTDGESVSNLTTTHEGTVTLYAIWKDYSFTNYRTSCGTPWDDQTWSYDTYSLSTGGSGATKTLSGTTHGTLSFASSNVSVISVDALTGAVSPVGAGTAYVIATWESDGTYCEKLMNSSTFTVTGTVTVTFKKNGGTGTDDQTQSITYNTATNLKTISTLGLTAPSCKYFYGWATSQSDADAGTRTYTDGQSVTLEEGVTLYAIWKTTQYTVSDGTLSGVDSHSYSATSIDCGTTLTITCAADASHKGNPTVTATGSHGSIEVVSTTSVTIANVQSDIAVSISYAAKENYAITWKVAGTALSGAAIASCTNNVLEGGSITALPSAPANNTLAACSANKFMGWAKLNADIVTPMTDADDIAALGLFTTAAGAPEITENTTFYAVFANSTSGTWNMGTITTIEKGATMSYANCNGSHTVTGSDGNDYSYTSYQIMNSSGNQFQSGAGYMYNTTPFPAMTQIFIDGGSNKTGYLSVYESDSEIGSNPGTLVALTGTPSDSYWDYTYTLSGKSYFLLKAGSETIKANEITITFGSATNYVTKCCTPLDEINGDKTSLVYNGVTLTWDDIDHVSSWTVTGVDGEDNAVPAGDIGTPTDGGSTYSCVISNLSQYTDYTFTITATPASGYCDKAVDIEVTTPCVAPSSLSISSTGSKWDFCAGESMTLTVSGTNISGSATYQWQKHNGSTWVDIDGATNVSYSTTMAANKAGQYRCTVTNPGSGSCDATTDGVWVRVWQLHLGDDDIDFTYVSGTTGSNSTDHLNSDTHYAFKLKDNKGGWFGLNDKTITATISAFALNGSGANVNVTSGLEGNYTFTINYSDKNNPTIAVTYPVGNQPSGRKIWFDKSIITGWTDAGTSDLVWRIGKSNNSMTNQDETANYFSLVPGTDRFYVYETKEYNGFEAWHVANNTSWSGTSDGSGQRGIYYHYHNQASTDVTRATVYQKYVIGTDGVTLVPTTKQNTDYYCDFWNVSKTDGMLTHTATITPPTNGTITIANAAQSLEETTTTADLPHRTILTVTATPAPGYQLSSLTVNGEAFTSGNEYILSADATIAATFTAKTITITWDGNGGNTPSPTESSYTYNGSTVSLATVTHATKLFAGWFTDPSAGAQITEIGTTNKPTADVTYYAHWVDGNTVIFHPGVGSVTPASVTQTSIGGAVDIPTPIIDCDGWSFAGWNIGSTLAETTTNPEASLQAAGSAAYVPASATVHMYAVWKKNFGGGTGTIANTYNWDDTNNTWSTNSMSAWVGDSNTSPHSGTKCGSNSTGGAYIYCLTKATTPDSLVFYYTKSSTNTTYSNKWHIQTSSDGSSWTTIESTLGNNSLTRGTWVKYKFDMTSYSNKYVRLLWSNGSSASGGTLDDVTFYYEGTIPDAWKWTSSANDYGCTPANQVKTPVISPDTEAQTGDVSVTITCATDDATIRYTTDGTNPTSSSGTVYSGAFTISCSATVKAIAYKATMDDSEIAEQEYTVTVPTPTFSLAEGTYYDANQSVTLSLPTAHTGTVIKYTTNGDDPTSSSATYSSAITVTEGTMTIKAIGYNATCGTTSAIASATYIVRFGETFSLVTDKDDLMAGDRVVIVSADATTSTHHAVSTTISANKRTATTDFNLAAGLATAQIYPALGAAATVQIFTLGGKPGEWTFHESTNEGYLNCPSAGKLTNTAVVSNSNKWTIDINGSYVATITNKEVTDAVIKSNTSSGHVFAAYGPATENVQLVKLYSVPNPDPVIKIDASLTAFSACRGIASDAQSFYVSGKNLDGSIVLSNVAPLAGYEFSTDGSSYSSTLELTPVSRTVAKTQIFVRLAATATAGTKNGNLNAAVSANSLSTNIAVSGSVSTADTYTDQIHNAVVANQCGEYYAPSIDDESKPDPGDEDCIDTHYKFMGWITEADRNSSAVKNDAWYLEHLITAGTSMTADGTNYYAVWAKEED